MESQTIIQIAGVLIALAALGWTAYSIYLNRKTTQAEFWLRLRNDFARYDEVHLKLRPGGEWASAGAGPSSVKEWAQVEGYMGLFEQCETMLSQGLLDEMMFSESYRYRVVNLHANPFIKKGKLIERADGWTRFIKLSQRLGLPDPRKTT